MSGIQAALTVLVGAPAVRMKKYILLMTVEKLGEVCVEYDGDVHIENTPDPKRRQV